MGFGSDPWQPILELSFVTVLFWKSHCFIQSRTNFSFFTRHIYHIFSLCISLYIMYTQYIYAVLIQCIFSHRLAENKAFAIQLLSKGISFPRWPVIFSPWGKKKKGRISRLVPPQTCRKKQVWLTVGDEMESRMCLGCPLWSEAAGSFTVKSNLSNLEWKKRASQPPLGEKK